MKKLKKLIKLSTKTDYKLVLTKLIMYCCHMNFQYIPICKTFKT